MSPYRTVEPTADDARMGWQEAERLAKDNELLRRLLLRISRIAYGRADAPEALRAIREALKEAHA